MVTPPSGAITSVCLPILRYDSCTVDLTPLKIETGVVQLSKSKDLRARVLNVMHKLTSTLTAERPDDTKSLGKLCMVRGGRALLQAGEEGRRGRTSKGGRQSKGLGLASLEVRKKVLGILWCMGLLNFR